MGCRGAVPDLCVRLKDDLAEGSRFSADVSRPYLAFETELEAQREGTSKRERALWVRTFRSPFLLKLVFPWSFSALPFRGLVI